MIWNIVHSVTVPSTLSQMVDIHIHYCVLCRRLRWPSLSKRKKLQYLLRLPNYLTSLLQCRAIWHKYHLPLAIMGFLILFTQFMFAVVDRNILRNAFLFIDQALCMALSALLESMYIFCLLVSVFSCILISPCPPSTPENVISPICSLTNP